MDEYKWEAATKDAHEAAAEAFAYCISNDEPTDFGARHDAAHEWADGCAWVIYTDASRGLWMDSGYVRDMEDTAEEQCEHRPGIDTLITRCVYLALAKRFEEGWESARLTHDESEAAE